MKPHILFDLDGTLTDPAEGITRCIQYALEKAGHPVPGKQELLPWIGPPLDESFGAYVPKGNPQALVALYRERFADVGLYENKVYPGIKELLESLHVDKKLYLATSKPHFFAKKILEHFGLAHYFTAIHGSELSGERTDKGELIQYLLKTENLQAQDCLMIGDRKHDTIGAKKNGILSVGVLWGYGPREELVEARADHIFATTQELGTFLKGRR